MNILLIGSGGREHALAWKLAQSNQCSSLHVIPGSDAIGMEEKITCHDISMDNATLVEFAVNNKISLVVIGPEAPLVAGLADALRTADIPVFGPSAVAAQLEGSKGFMKDLCAKYNIPTADYARFTNKDAAITYIKEKGAPIVVKADGLAAGKGVIVAEKENEAIAAVKDMLSGNSFGDAGSSVVIEEFLNGEEVSFFALADGKTVQPLTSAQDHKRAFDGDTGPNTGGMGAYSPARDGIWSDELANKVMTDIIEPTVNAMAEEGCPFTGVLYAGLMVKDGKAKLLEYNVRFGDPECQPIMMRLDTDLVDILSACAHGDLSSLKDKINWKTDTAICVVMAAKGYPGEYSKNTDITLPEKKPDGTKIFHAGTKHNESGKWLSTGGRVLGITSLAHDKETARLKSYQVIDSIEWDEGFYRADIGTARG